LLWQALHERATREQAYSYQDQSEPDMDPNLLATLLGIRGVIQTK
jgi:hypothetical protein